MRRQRQFDPAGAAADNRQAEATGAMRALEERFPAPGEAGDRLYRDRVLGGARYVVEARRRSDVERGQVIADRRMGAAQDVMGIAVEADRLIMDQPRAGKAGEPYQVDMAVLKAVMARDIAGQHPGIGRLQFARDQRQAHAFFRLHAKAFQHVDMRVAAADEDEILGNRNELLHWRYYARGGGRAPFPIAELRRRRNGL